MRIFLLAFFGGIALGAGCSGLVIDRSMPAADAGDYTLAVSACEAVPGHGMDVCRVREGAAMDSSWKLVIPAQGRGILGWEADLYYRDVAQPLHAVGTGSVVELPWREFFHEEVWQRHHSGEAMALVTVRYRTPEGLEELVRFKGIAKLVVLAQGYDRLPIDSGFSTWGTTCRIQYSTAGRGALQCK